MLGAVVLCALFLATVEVQGGIPWVVPTVGRVWPKPQQERSRETYMVVRPGIFRFSLDSPECPLLNKVVARYLSDIFPKRKQRQSVKYSKTREFVGYLDAVTVHVMSDCEDMPYLNMDELYELKIDSPDRPGEGMLIASTVWGAMRGLESFSQLLVSDEGAYRINSTQIMDYPRFPHRGLMIDTSRHFLPLSSIFATLDLMCMNKYNVLHWHIVDSQSFPYVSEVFPKLSAAGAWSPAHVYSADDMAQVISYAVERGIRVLPEFDTPGHTDSWGPGQPGLLTECYNSSTGVPDGTFGPVDPTNEDNYEFLKNLFTEVMKRFPDHYLHLGGDEVPFDCWASNPKVREFMQAANISGDYAALEEYYITRLVEIVAELPTKNGYMVWQEVFDNGVKLAPDTVVHIWKDGGNATIMEQELANVTSAGFQTLLSSCWYLNEISYGVDWHTYYLCDPQNFTGTQEQKALVVGGEACMWGEWVDRTNLIPRTWPRASVVAEKLWSAANATTSPDEASPRLEEHRCRMLGRGYPVEPLWPSYCDADVL